MTLTLKSNHTAGKLVHSGKLTYQQHVMLKTLLKNSSIGKIALPLNLTEKRTISTWCVFLLAGDVISPLVDLLSGFFSQAVSLTPYVSRLHFCYSFCSASLMTSVGIVISSISLISSKRNSIVTTLSDVLPVLAS